MIGPLLRALAVFVLLLAGAVTAHADDLDEPVGPPLYTSAGCRADEPFTVEYVSGVIGVSKSVVLRMLKRYGFHPWQVCALDARRLAPLIEATRKNKFGYDEPDEAMRYRRLSYIDASGGIRPDGIARAARQRKANADAHRNNKSSLQQKAAGVSAGSWAALGPFTIGGRVRAIAPHPSISDRILVGSVAGGIFKTTNGGATWTSVNDYLPSVAISCLIHDPSNPSVVYACTGEGFFNVDAVRGMGILKSTDGGDTWAQMPGTSPALSSSWNYVNRLAIDPSNPQVMLAGTVNGIMRTTDGGASWTLVTFATVHDVKFNADGSGAVLSEQNATAWSSDHGATWTRINTAGGRAELAYSASTGNWFMQLDAGGGQVYKSTNGGASWTFLSTSAVLGNQGWYDNAIWVDPFNENRIIVGGSSSGIKMSVNGGTTFSAIGAGVHADYHALVHDPAYASNGVVYVGNDGGIYKFTGVNAVTTPQFAPPSPPSVNLNNLPITQFYGGGGGTVPATRLMGGTQDNGNLAWHESTGTWLQIATGDGGRATVQQTDDNYMYGELQWLAVLRSRNGGSDSYGVEMICTGLTDADCGTGTRSTNFIAPIVLDQANPDRLYAGGASLWRTDNARDPTAANVVWTRVKPAGPFLNAIAVAPSNSNVVWVGDNNGNLFRTLDAGSATPTWSAAMTPASGRQAMRIIVDRDDPARVYAAFGGYTAGNLMMTTNGLDPSPVWVSRSGSSTSALPDAPVRALARHPFNADWLYAGTEVGLFTSEDGGLTWVASNDGPGTVSVEDVFFIDSSRIVVVTHGRGMYMASVVAPPIAPGSLQLSTSTLTIGEGQSGVLQVSRAGGSDGAIGVTVMTVSGTATAGGDFTAINQSLTWAAGDTSTRTITINTLADAIAEGNETFTVQLSAPTGGAILGNPSATTVTIADPDAFPAGCTMPDGWTTPPGTTVGWTVDTSTAFEGRCSLRAGTPASFEEARVQYADNFAAGNITFNARVDAQPRTDCFHFYIDGTEQNTGSNCIYGGTLGNLGLGSATGTDTGWRAFSFPVSAGNHTVVFSYRKNSSQGSGGADTAWLDNVSMPIASTGPVLIAATSRKTHASKGTFDIPIDASRAIDGAVSVESRVIGAGHKIVFQFSKTITSPGSVTCVDATGAPLGSASATAVGNNVEVILTGIPDASRATIALANVNNVGVNAAVSMGFLVGDVDGTRVVTASDILRSKAMNGSALINSNARYDFDTSGIIDTADVNRLRENAGVGL